MRLNDSNSFLSKVKKAGITECWEWLGGKHRIGYGNFYINCTKYQAHRYAWILENGKIPDGLCVLHKCDNRGCCNPAHLFLGTQKDNIADMVAKGRHRGASNNKNNAKINSEKARIIRYWWSLGNMTQERIGKFFGITQTSAKDVIHNISWSK